MAVFAVAEKVGDRPSSGIEAGVRYPVLADDGDVFEIELLWGRAYCLWEGCAHLEGLNWTRIEE